MAQAALIRLGMTPQLGANKMAQTTFNDGDALSVVRAAINGNANDAQSKLVNQVAINTLADISQFLVSTTYELPSGTYYFNNSIDFLTADILLTDANGCYDFRTNCIAVITYTGTTPFITSGAAGQVVTFSPWRITTTNALVFDGDGFAGNSFISNFGIFVSCKEMVRLTGWDFFTVDSFAGIDCEAGITLTDVNNVICLLGQWNLTQGNGSAFVTLLGASSGRFIGALPNSQPALNDFFFDVQSTFGGSISMIGGDHTLGAGSFFKTSGGSRDQDDVDIRVTSITGVEDSQEKVKGYIADGAEVSTTIVQGSPVVLAGTWTNTVAKRFTMDAAGKVTYNGIEDGIFPITAKLLVTPASGTNKEYDLHIRKNGATLDPASRDVVKADSGNPAKAVVITELALSTTDYFEIVVTGANTSTAMIGSAATLII